MVKYTALSAYCFTLNNYNDEDIIKLMRNELIKYGCFGKEVGESGTPHLQGYFELHKKKSPKSIHKQLNIVNQEGKNKIWIEPRKGTQKQAINYCKKGIQSHVEFIKEGENGENFGKQANFTEWGTKCKQGLRKDLDLIRQEAYENGMRAVTLKANMQQIKVAEKFLTYHESPRQCDKVEVIYIFGCSGNGKTQKAIELAGDDYYMYRPAIQEKWWDGYDGHKTVIMDDIRASHFANGVTLLSYLDKYECRVPYKGGFRQLRAEKIIITSLEHPQNFWSYPDEPYEQFYRRLSKVIWIKDSMQPTVVVEPKLITVEIQQEVFSKKSGVI